MKGAKVVVIVVVVVVVKEDVLTCFNSISKILFAYCSNQSVEVVQLRALTKNQLYNVRLDTD